MHSDRSAELDATLKERKMVTEEGGRTCGQALTTNFLGLKYTRFRCAITRADQIEKGLRILRLGGYIIRVCASDEGDGGEVARGEADVLLLDGEHLGLAGHQAAMPEQLVHPRRVHIVKAGRECERERRDVLVLPCLLYTSPSPRDA